MDAITGSSKTFWIPGTLKLDSILAHIYLRCKIGLRNCALGQLSYGVQCTRWRLYSWAIKVTKIKILECLMIIVTYCQGAHSFVSVLSVSITFEPFTSVRMDFITFATLTRLKALC